MLRLYFVLLLGIGPVVELQHRRADHYHQLVMRANKTTGGALDHEQCLADIRRTVWHLTGQLMVGRGQPDSLGDWWQTLDYVVDNRAAFHWRSE